MHPCYTSHAPLLHHQTDSYQTNAWQCGGNVIVCSVYDWSGVSLIDVTRVYPRLITPSLALYHAILLLSFVNTVSSARYNIERDIAFIPSCAESETELSLCVGVDGV